MADKTRLDAEQLRQLCALIHRDQRSVRACYRYPDRVRNATHASVMDGARELGYPLPPPRDQREAA